MSDSSCKHLSVSKKFVMMATITTEFGKVDTKKQRAVYLRLRDKKTEKRIATGIRVNESEISPKTKKIRNFEKAQAVEN